MDKEIKIISISFKNEEKNEKRTLRIVASDETVDRDGDIIRAKGWILDNYLKNPVMLAFHNWRGEPVAKVNKVYVDGDKLIIEDIEFAPTDEGKKFKELVDKGFIKTVSVGFIPRKVFYLGDESQFEEMKSLDEEWINKNLEKLAKANRVIWEAELLEVSFVPIPANPNALIQFANKGLDVAFVKNDEGELIEIDLTPYREYKGVIPYSVHPKNMKVRKSTSWDKKRAIKSLLKWASSDGSGDWEKVNKRKFRAGFGYVDDANADKLSAYKYPHHYAEGETFYVDERGVQVAMAFCLARKGNLTEEEFKKLYNHLAKHYTNDLKKEPPEWKDIAYTFKELIKIFDKEIITEFIKEYPEEAVKYIVELEKEIKFLSNKIDKIKNQNSSPSPEEGEVDNEEEIKIEFNEEELKETISLAIKQFLRTFKGGN